MKRQTISIKCRNIVELIEDSKELNTTQKQKIAKIATKAKENLVNTFIDNLIIRLNVRNIDAAMQKLEKENIVNIVNFEDAYLLKLLYHNNEDLLENCNIYIMLSNLKKEDSNQVFFIKSCLFIALFCDKGITVDVNKIENILSGKNNNFIKGAKKSKIGTIFDIAINNTYRTHPKSKNRLIQVNELLSERYKLKDKHINLHCPVCGQEYFIDKNSIDRIIVVKRNTITFTCHHLDSKHIKEPPYKINLGSMLMNNKLSKSEKQIYFINNFERLKNEKS